MISMNERLLTAATVSVLSVLLLAGAASAQVIQFEQVIQNLESTGIFEFFLPFILIFAVVFGMLQKTKIFGSATGEKADPGVTKINAIIAFAFAAFIMVYPTTSTAIFSITDYMANFVGGTFIYIIGIIVFLVIMYMIATPLSGGETKPIARAGTVGAIVAFVLIVALFFSSGGTEIFPGINTNFSFPSLYFANISPTVIALVIVLVVMGLAIYWITKS